MKKIIILIILGTVLVTVSIIKANDMFPYGLILSVIGGLLIGWNMVEIFKK